MKESVRLFSTPAEMASKLAEEIVRRIVASANSEKPYSIALSGGTTPELLYSFLFDEYAGSVPWEFVHLFWGDERCVPPGDSESNYGIVSKLLVEKTGLPASNVHRIKGEENPVFEAIRYSKELSAILPVRDKLPVFDLVLLGLGEDGHTASIFPDQLHLLNSERFCDVAEHPSTNQKRITLTGRVINNAEATVFLVTGKKKAHVVSAVINGDETSERYPAAHIKPVYGSLDFFLDREAGSLL